MRKKVSIQFNSASQDEADGRGIDRCFSAELSPGDSFLARHLGGSGGLAQIAWNFINDRCV
jgi:hypothetical protein